MCVHEFAPNAQCSYFYVYFDLDFYGAGYHKVHAYRERPKTSKESKRLILSVWKRTFAVQTQYDLLQFSMRSMSIDYVYGLNIFVNLNYHFKKKEFLYLLYFSMFLRICDVGKQCSMLPIRFEWCRGPHFSGFIHFSYSRTLDVY